MKTAQIGLSDLKTPYVPVAIYLEDADSVEDTCATTSRAFTVGLMAF